MFRWEKVTEKTLYDMTVKMYRDPFEPLTTSVALFQNLDLDHYAYKYLQSELYMYKIMDTNWEQFIEERGDVERLAKIMIPTSENTTKTIL